MKNIDEIINQLSLSTEEKVTIPSKTGAPLVKAGTMYESLRYAEYEITSGLGEITDNAVEAGANNIHIITKTQPTAPTTSKKKKVAEVIDEIAVIDDGEGMAPEILSRCLVLGDSPRPRKPSGLGIGRFGVGLTLGGISLARRLEVYSRNDKNGKFYYTFLDLDVIKDESKAFIPKPIAIQPPKEYLNYLEGSTGTIIILKKCDRLQYDSINNRAIDADSQIKGLSNYLGRTFRKYIYGGINIYLNGGKVYLHDPLYRLGPTRFDMDPKSMEDPRTNLKAKLWGKTTTIEIEIPGKTQTYANVEITLTLLPKEWRLKEKSGGSTFATDRKIHENEGISILRANREVLYGAVPYIIGKRGQSRPLDIDRWWGCEISFPPELDELFTVRYIKRGAEPVAALRNKIREIISPAIKALREQIQQDRREEVQKEATKAGLFAGAEQTMAEADKTMAKGKKGSTVSKEEAEKEFKKLAKAATNTTSGTDNNEKSAEEKKRELEEKKKELEEKPYNIIPIEYPESIFFETQHMLDHIVVKLNINHPFYKDIFEPLCGSIQTMDAESDVYEGTKTIEQQKIRRAFMLLILSYAKAESFFEDHDSVLKQLRAQWGMALGVVLNSVVGKE
ncbi:ATP-binding protein [Bacillus cereus]|nr:ATP-binding protein [Bacillus cereus]